MRKLRRDKDKDNPAPTSCGCSSTPDKFELRRLRPPRLAALFQGQHRFAVAVQNLRPTSTFAHLTAAVFNRHFQIDGGRVGGNVRRINIRPGGLQEAVKRQRNVQRVGDVQIDIRDKSRRAPDASADCSREFDRLEVWSTSSGMAAFTLAESAAKPRRRAAQNSTCSCPDFRSPAFCAPGSIGSFMNRLSHITARTFGASKRSHGVRSNPNGMKPVLLTPRKWPLR